MLWRLGPIGVGLLAMGLGLLGADRPALALEVAIGIPFVVIVFIDLPLAVGLFLVSQFLVPNTGGVAKIGGALLLAGSIQRMSSRRGRSDSLLAVHPVLSLLLVASVVWVAASVAWSSESATAASNALRYALNATLFFVVFAAVRTPRDVAVILGAFVVGAALSAAYGAVGGGNLTQPGRLVGTTGEANELATYLVAGLILSTGLLVAWRRRAPGLASAALVCGAVCAAGIALTLSRAGLVALAVSLLSAVMVIRRHRAAISLMAVLVAAGIALYFLALAPTQAYQRIFDNPSGTSGRTALWTVAMRMVSAEPVTGVGIGNFPVRSIHFLDRPGRLGNDRYVSSEPLEAHSIYLQLLAETGVVGFLLFAAVVVPAMWQCWIATRPRGSPAGTQVTVLAQTTLLAVVSVLVANAFAPGLFDKQMWLLLALGPTLFSLPARQQSRAPVSLLGGR